MELWQRKSGGLHMVVSGERSQGFRWKNSSRSVVATDGAQWLIIEPGFLHRSRDGLESYHMESEKRAKRLCSHSELEEWWKTDVAGKQCCTSILLGSHWHTLPQRAGDTGRGRQRNNKHRKHRGTVTQGHKLRDSHTRQYTIWWERKNIYIWIWCIFITCLLFCCCCYFVGAITLSTCTYCVLYSQQLQRSKAQQIRDRAPAFSKTHNACGIQKKKKNWRLLHVLATSFNWKMFVRIYALNNQKQTKKLFF